MSDSTELMVWAQMFFEDGSVSQGIRVTSDVFDNNILLYETGKKLLISLNRDEGHLLVWGAGALKFTTIMLPISS